VDLLFLLKEEQKCAHFREAVRVQAVRVQAVRVQAVRVQAAVRVQVKAVMGYFPLNAQTAADPASVLSLCRIILTFSMIFDGVKKEDMSFLYKKGKSASI